MADGARIFGVYHVAILGNWEEIVQEQVALLTSSGLLAASQLVFVGVCGGTPDDLPLLPPKCRVVRHVPSVRLGENTTLDWVRTWASGRANDGDLLYYIHTKGASKPHSAPDRYWRWYMQHFCISRWRDCVDALKQHDVCGVEYVDPDRSDDWFTLYGWRPTRAAFLGNFWWSRLAHVARLPHVPLTVNRYQAEWNFITGGSPAVYSFHQSGRCLYRYLYTPPDVHTA